MCLHEGNLLSRYSHFILLPLRNVASLLMDSLVARLSLVRTDLHAARSCHGLRWGRARRRRGLHTREDTEAEVQSDIGVREQPVQSSQRSTLRHPLVFPMRQVAHDARSELNHNMTSSQRPVHHHDVNPIHFHLFIQSSVLVAIRETPGLTRTPDNGA